MAARHARVTVSLCFMIMGLTNGVWVARIPGGQGAGAAGGRADPERPGSGLAKVVGFGYAGMAGGPAMIGAVASQVGLPLALGIPVVLALWIAVAAPILAETSGQQRVAVGGVATRRSGE